MTSIDMTDTQPEPPDEEPTDAVDAAPEADPAADTPAADAAPAEGGDATDEDVIDAEELVAPVESPYDRPGRWYVVHTQSGYEKKVKQNLEART
jgi:transcriptional antiterminator NusG